MGLVGALQAEHGQRLTISHYMSLCDLGLGPSLDICIEMDV